MIFTHANKQTRDQRCLGRGGCEYDGRPNALNEILILQSHLWAPETQKESIKVRLIAPLYVIEADRVLQALANQYGLSYRLVKMMCTDPVMQMETAVAEPNILEMSVTSNKSEEKTQQNVSSGDLEGAYHLDQLDPVAASAEVASLGYLSFSNIINQIWHFCSVDYGPKCKSRFSAFKNDTDRSL